MGYLSKFLRLSFSKQRFLVEAVLLLTAMRIGLRLLPYRVLRRFLSQSDRTRAVKHFEEDCLKKDVIWAINKGGKFILRENSCLPLALAGQTLLRLHGFPARLCLGFQKNEDESIRAHAWVESNGQVVIGGPENEIEQYVPLVEYQDKDHEWRDLYPDL